jgi:hypothetical protein
MTNCEKNNNICCTLLYFNINNKKMTKYYYHGSEKNITGTVLDPRPSRVIDNEKAVFATNTKALALLFIPKWSDNDFELTCYNNHIYFIENYPNAFDHIFSDKSGYIYQVDKQKFHSDDRLGMKNHEFISDSTVQIQKKEYIPDIVSILKQQTDIRIIKFDNKMKWIEQAYEITMPRNQKSSCIIL